MTTSEQQYSISPAGEKFLIPSKADYSGEFNRIEKMIKKERAEGKEIVAVLGVGFVGAVMAAIVADTTDESGKPVMCSFEAPIDSRTEIQTYI